MNERLLKFIDGLKAESKIAAESEKTSENIAVANATEKNNFQKDGGKIMSRFNDRSTQFPGRIKLTKVAEDSDGTVYDSVPAEGEVYSEGTPLNSQTLNALENDLKSGTKLYRHRIALSANISDTGSVTRLVGITEVYTNFATAITTSGAVAPALGITSGSADIPVNGCDYVSDHTVLITKANVSASGITLYGMYFGYFSGNGIIRRISASVTSVSDTVTQII